MSFCTISISKMPKAKAFISLTAFCALYVLWESQRSLQNIKDEIYLQSNTSTSSQHINTKDENIPRETTKEVKVVENEMERNATREPFTKIEQQEGKRTRPDALMNKIEQENEHKKEAILTNRDVEADEEEAGKFREREVKRDENIANTSQTLRQITTSWDVGWVSWEAEQKRRKAVIKNACKALGLPQRGIAQYLASQNYFQQFLVDDKHRALYCFIPKIACTNWKKVWMVLTGLTNERNLTKIPLMTPHHLTERMELVSQVRRFNEIPPRIQKYKKLLIVRHPFQRLLSAYRDKIHIKMGQPYFQRQVLPYVKKIRPSANMTNMQWPEFVDFLNIKGGLKGDNHWRSYEALCHPCAIEYDVVAKFQTLLEDSERFLRLIGAPDDLHFPNTSRTSRRVDRDFWNYYEKMLSREQLTRLYKSYERDFKIFEYD